MERTKIVKILNRGRMRNLLSTPQSIEFIRNELQENSKHTRHSLARKVCAQFDLRDSKNELRTCRCRLVLMDLSQSGKFILPGLSARGSRSKHSRMVRVGEPLPEAVGLEERVDRLSDLQIIRVERDDLEKRKIWNELMIREHPQGRRRLMGFQIRYLIKSEDYWLGGLGFSACALQLKDRDNWMGGAMTSA